MQVTSYAGLSLRRAGTWCPAGAARDSRLAEAGDE